MSVGSEIVESLQDVQKRLANLTIDEISLSGYVDIEKVLLDLSSQFKVHQALHETAIHLVSPNPKPKPKPKPSRGTHKNLHKHRLERHLEVLFGTKDSENIPLRWQTMRKEGCAVIIFIAISYPPADLSRMSSTQFDFLLSAAPRCLDRWKLPPGWLFENHLRELVCRLNENPHAANFIKGL